MLTTFNVPKPGYDNVDITVFDTPKWHVAEVTSTDNMLTLIMMLRQPIMYKYIAAL